MIAPSFESLYILRRLGPTQRCCPGRLNRLPLVDSDEGASHVTDGGRSERTLGCHLIPFDSLLRYSSDSVINWPAAW